MLNITIRWNIGINGFEECKYSECFYLERLQMYPEVSLKYKQTSNSYPSILFIFVDSNCPFIKLKDIIWFHVK